VRYVESGYWALSGNLANSGHCIPLVLEINSSRVLYHKPHKG
jgi:hypothetical protein